MAAGITDLLTQATVNSRPVPTTVASTRAAAGTTLSCLSLTGWPTGTAVHFITYKINTSGAKIAGSQIDWKGIVSGTNITNLTLKAGTDVGSAIGDVVEASPTAAYANDLYSWGSAHANQDGSLITSAVQTALSLGTGTLNGWNVLAFPPTTVTANGNRSYTLVTNGQDLTTTLSPGMRIRTQRTVAAPTQCTSLNGTTQYYSRSSAGLGTTMTFTNNFTVSAWVKLSSYAGGTNVSTIASRYNGTSGWIFYLNGSGQLGLQGLNGGAANSFTSLSYQSIPLNKWVHISAQLDMTVTTTGTTNNYIMIDGVEVPNTATRGGTNPVSLIQAGNLEIGSFNAGAAGTFFAGKIAQVAIYSAKVTQATILASMNQGLAGTETSLISAYSFNNTVNDLNANANNLTANGSAVATNADSPFGGQAGGSISSTLDYAEVLDVSFSTNTTMVVRATDVSTIPTSGGVSAVSYSTQFAPYGYPNPADRTLGETILGAGFSTASLTAVQVPGNTVTVYAPANRRLKITAFCPGFYTTGGAADVMLTIWDGTVGSGTQIGASNATTPAASNPETAVALAKTTPTSAGSKTYNVGLQTTSNTGQFQPLITQPAYLLVEYA